MRINKYISESGALSRRKADEAIAGGRVTLNGREAVPGDQVKEGDAVLLDGRPLSPVKKKVIVAYYKPLGLVCTAKEADKDSLYHHFDYPEKLIYVGRLDKDSQGLILMTNDGDLANRIQKARYGHEKEYVVRVNKPVTGEFLQGMRSGVPILDTVTKKCRVMPQGEMSFRIILTEGLNRQIRRMCEYFGYRVTYLKRIRVMNVKLGSMKPGMWRELEPEEEKKLRKMAAEREVGREAE